MHVDTFYQIGGIVVAILAFLGVVGGTLRWFYRRGGTEREYKIALDANTQSNKDLTGAVGKVVDKLNEHDKRLDHAEWRLDNLEAPTRVSVSVDRNPSPAGGH